MATKRQLQAQATKQKIIDAVQELVEERGYDDVTIDDIASRCDIGKGTLYHYFKGKEAVFDYIQGERFDDVLLRVQKMGLSTIEDKLRTYCSLWAEHVSKDSVNMSAHWYRQALAHSLPRQEEANHFSIDIGNIELLLKESVEAGELTSGIPAHLIATDIVFSLNGAAFYRCIDQKFDAASWFERFIGHMITIHVAPYKTAS